MATIMRWTTNFPMFSMDTAKPVYTPALDILENSDHVELRFDLPGVNPENVNIQVENGVLSVDTEFNTDETHENAHYAYRERFQGAYRRSVQLPDTLMAAQAEASFNNGVLTVRIPKKPEAKPVKIQVNVPERKALKSGK